MKKCSNCVWCIQEDFGYSNYTVEGTQLYCFQEKNPLMPFDRWYGEDERDRFAENCDMFEEGCGVYIDVDREGPEEDYPNTHITLESLKKGGWI